MLLHLSLTFFHNVGIFPSPFTMPSSTKAKIFAIRCGINYVYQVPNVDKIIVITDTIYAVRHILIH